MFDINLSDDCIVKIESSSDGSQDKYFKDGYWYKVDKYGGEGTAEELVSILLQNTSLKLNEYVNYEVGYINGVLGCRSQNFLEPQEQFISFTRVHELLEGCSFGQKLIGKPLPSKIGYCISFFQNNFFIDVSNYLSKVFYLDMLIRNEDRNFGNLGLIYNTSDNKYRFAPIFDNGYSLLVGDEPFKHIGNMNMRLKSVSGKPFSSNLEMQAKQFVNYIQIDYESLYASLEDYPESLQKSALLCSLELYKHEFNAKETVYISENYEK